MLGHADDGMPGLIDVVSASAKTNSRRRAHFLHVALELFQQSVVGATVTTGMEVVDQRQRAVFEFARGIGLGVDVADFL